MVGSKLPIPILKYIDIDPTKLDRVINEYPFYQLPLIAKILKQNILENQSLIELNFFGFNRKRLETYSQIYSTLKSSPSDYHKTLVDIEPEVSFHDIHIELKEDNLDQLESENNQANSILGDSKTNVSENGFTAEINIDSLDLEAKNSEINLSLEDKVINLSSEENNNIEILDENDGVSANSRETIEIIDLAEPLAHDVSKSIDFDFSTEEDTSEEELAQKLSQSNELEESKDLLDLSLPYTYSETIPGNSVNLEFNNDNTTSDEELAERLAMEDSIRFELQVKNVNHISPIEQTIEIESQNIEEKLVTPKLEIELDKINEELIDSEGVDLIEFENIKETSYILPGAFEIVNDDSESNDELMIDETSNSPSSNLDFNTETISIVSSKQDTEVKDFSAWLTKFSSEEDNSKDFTNSLSNEDEESGNDELSKSIQANAINIILQESLQREDVGQRINRDDELEGVLKDNFFKTQVELKKVSRKTPSDLRIQDEAQLSLQPLDIVSETLAILHLQQGNTFKAIEIYEKLIALIPEKSSFFALQIEKLRK